ncbi:type III secretion system gatekeeper subunit SctW [Pseudomonas mucidolens]|uniref:Type III secretion protein W n=1 Tax=Pseudomonas mucidolens TaxID=46679 RepID=A0A1H2NIS6_9PSED|nr:type III secretion system gatekeeper subunit SctW [Pseudomonas mucidolens]SDV04716.1 type III secretion protein W [Pseudomonas mucidolens]SQH31941.1 type III secretion regulator RspJ [Pseudomonas mucidolens]
MKVEARHSEVEKINQLNRASVVAQSPLPTPRAAQHNAAEEVGLLFSQQMERRSKSLDQRQLVVAGPGQRVQKVEHLAQLYEQLGHPGQESLAHLARQVRVLLLQKTSVEGLLALTGGDPARTYVVLEHISAQAEAEARQVEAARACDFLTTLTERYKAQIQAALNIALSLQKGTDDQALRQAVRQLYYSSVVVRQSLATMMQALLELFGGEQFNRGLQVMRRALADDVGAQVSSVPTAKLRTLLLGLQACGQLNTVLRECAGLALRLTPQAADSNQQAVVLLQRLLGYASTGIAPGEVERLGCEFGGEALSSQLVSLNALYPLMQRLPMALWRDSRSRQESLSNFLLCMGQSTAVEGRTTSSLAQVSA